MESIIEYLKRNLRAAGTTRWEAIAAECGIAKTLPRKIACNDRDNPGVQTVQPLIDYFRAIERGERQLPPCGLPGATPSQSEALPEVPTSLGVVTRRDLRPDDSQEIWPELDQTPSNEVVPQAVVEGQLTPEIDTQPVALRTGTVRRQNARRERDPQADAGRRENLPSPLLDNAAIQQVN